MGAFSKSARPVIPGSYFNWVASQPAAVPGATGAKVCLPFTSDWGPLNEAVLVQSFQEYLAIFGPSVGTPGYNAVFQAFYGEGGIDGRYGAGSVLCYRMGGSSVLAAHHTFQNTTPANALAVTAKYEGSYGNNLSITTQDHAADSTKEEFIVKLGSLVVETYVYTDTDVAALATAINAGSQWITASELITGVKLAHVTDTALSAGDDGTTTAGGDWDDLLSALESQQFDIIAFYGLEDTDVWTSIAAWASGANSSGSGRNAKGQRFQVFYGSPTDEDAATCVDDAALSGDGDFCFLGMGHVTDSVMVDANGDAQTLAPSQACVRLAGILAGRGEAMSITSARMPGWSLANGANAADTVTCMNGGVMTLSQDSDPVAPVKVTAARTTFTEADSSGDFPYVIYRNPKFMRTMQAVETEFTQYANSKLIGKLPVNNKTRDTAVGEVTKRLGERQAVGVVLPGFTVKVDQNPPPSDEDEFIALEIGIKFGRSVEQTFFTVNVG